MKVACMMMQRDENRLLTPWLRYHSYLFGSSNVFVFDNGSTEARTLTALREHHNRNGYCSYIHAQRKDLERKGDIIASYIKLMDSVGSYDMYIPLEVSEFVALRVGSQSICTSRDAINEHLLHFIGRKEALSIRGSLINILGKPLNFSFYPEKSTFFLANTIASLDEGFHDGKTKCGSEIVTDIVHLQYLNRPYLKMLSYARDKLSTRVENFDRETLLAYKGAVSHLVKYLLMSEDEYLSLFNSAGDTIILDWAERLGQLGTRVPYSEGSLP